jgi:hypothetical protein
MASVFARSSVVAEWKPKLKSAPDHLVMYTAQLFLENFDMNPYGRYRGDDVVAEVGNPDNPDAYLRGFTTREELESFYLDFTPTKAFTKYDFDLVFKSLVKHHRVVKEKEGKLVWGYRPKTVTEWVPI